MPPIRPTVLAVEASGAPPLAQLSAVSRGPTQRVYIMALCSIPVKHLRILGQKVSEMSIALGRLLKLDFGKFAASKAGD